MSPTITTYLKDGEAAAAGMPATRRSIIRYLRRYERNWKQEEVSMPASHFVMCRPPEENGKWLTHGRVNVALGQLRKHGWVQRTDRGWSLTDGGRAWGDDLLVEERT